MGSLPSGENLEGERQGKEVGVVDREGLKVRFCRNAVHLERWHRTSTTTIQQETRLS